jgi:hypothetical protein
MVDMESQIVMRAINVDLVELETQVCWRSNPSSRIFYRAAPCSGHACNNMDPPNLVPGEEMLA